MYLEDKEYLWLFFSELWFDTTQNIAASNPVTGRLRV